MAAAKLPELNAGRVVAASAELHADVQMLDRNDGAEKSRARAQQTRDEEKAGVAIDEEDETESSGDDGARGGELDRSTTVDSQKLPYSRIRLTFNAQSSVIVLPFFRHDVGFDVLRGLQGMPWTATSTASFCKVWKHRIDEELVQGAAANVPTAIGILGVMFSLGKYKNFAFAAYGAGAPMGFIFGNILGGVIA
ncbi:hypothetical protein JOL62DRAFT_556852 [Phyllosticta paracitricarpa]|uniref:Uncharacterized protein n=1 Tax=Phyllosticta paracitricarpa TaxID=2016321 RepID=A0ABR1N624_9PEZI